MATTLGVQPLLTGLRVYELSTMITAPLAGSLLADWEPTPSKPNSHDAHLAEIARATEPQ